MALFLSSVDGNIKNTLDERQEQVDTNRAGWLSKKTPWIRFTSMARVNGDSELRKYWIMYGGLAKDDKYSFGYDDMYNLGDDRYENRSGGSAKHTSENSIRNRPMPGITEVSVENKGSMGAVREAVITFVCWDKKQLNILEKLFMTFGISCLLEWGWSIKNDGTRVDKNLSLKEPMTDEKITTEYISEWTSTSGGHYDALQGPVVDFSWNLRDDGGFDCSTTVTSRASSLLAINTHGKSGEIGSSQIDDVDENTMEEDMKAMFNNVAFAIEANGTLKNKDNEVAGQLIEVKGDFEKDDEDLGALSSSKTKASYTTVNSTVSSGQIDKKNQGYITWGYLEELVNDHIFFKTVGSNDSGKSIPSLDTNKRDHGWINYRTNLLSGDPYICVLPAVSLKFGQEYTKRMRRGGKRRSKIPVKRTTDPKITGYEFYVIEPELKNNFFKPGNTNRVQLTKILINIGFVYHTFKSTNTLNEFLIGVLNGISEACGNMWDFQLMIDEEDPTVIYVVDTKTINVDVIEPYMFNVYNKNSIAKNVTFNTEVDQRLKAMAMYGSTKYRGDDNNDEANESGNESSYGYKLYGEHVFDLANGQLVPANNPSDDQNKGKTKTNQPPPVQMDALSNLYNSIVKLVDDRTPETSDRLKSAINKIVVDFDVDNGKVASNKEFIMLPLKLGLTIDGIAGVRFGNAIDIDYKPERYSKFTYFQITNVSHTINADTWDTSFETVMRVDMDKYEGIKATRLRNSPLLRNVDPGGAQHYNVPFYTPPSNTFTKGQGPII